MNENTGMESGVELLRNAIVKQAADDYVEASAIIQIGKMKSQRLYKEPDLIKAERLKGDCVAFFKSKWAGVLMPNTDIPAIVEKLDELIPEKVIEVKKKRKKDLESAKKRLAKMKKGA